MELIGERWSLMVLRELLLGPRRFTDLRASLPGISAKVLTERLASLEEAGALQRQRLPPPANVQLYALTEWGLAAEPAIRELGRWAAQHSGHDPTLPLSPVSLMISMRTMLDREAAAGFAATIGFEIAGEAFRADLGDGELPAFRRVETAEGAAIIRAPAAATVAALLYAGVEAAELERDAGLVIDGDRTVALRYCALFKLPAKLA